MIDEDHLNSEDEITYDEETNENNRQFRYEEKDKTGLVKGHYGFYDRHGKLQIVHYDSHPRGGFHAESNFGKV